MRLAWVCLVGLIGCGDDGGSGDGGMPDAAIDAPDLAGPVAVEFAPALPFTPPASPTTDFVLGPDGRLYGLKGARVHVSIDGGATFSPVASTQPIGNLVANGGALFGRDGSLTTPVLKRSLDNGASFQTIDVPGLGADDRLFLAAAGDDLWVQPVPTPGPTVLQHSTNNGTSFTPLALPIEQGANFFMTATDDTLLVSNAFGTFRTDGTTWTDLGPTPVMFEHNRMLVTQAGTVLGFGSGTFARRAVGDTTWTTESFVGAYGAVLQRPGGQLVRVKNYTGTVETSDDDGVTWQPVSGPSFDCTLLELRAFDTGLVGSCFDGTMSMNLRLPTGATSWVLDVPSNQAPAGAMTDVGFTDAGRVVLASRIGVWYSDDRGTTWTRTPWRPDDVTPITALAVAPDGNQMFVGSTLGRYAFLDGDGAALQESTVGPPDEDIVQAAYLQNTEVLVTTTEDQFTSGGVWSGMYGRVGTWTTVNPYRLESNPQFDPTAGFLGLAACGETVAVGVRRWFGTNAWNNELLVKFQYYDFNALWFDTELPPVGALPVRAMSCAENGTVALTFWNETDSTLFVGRLQGFGGFRPVETTTLPRNILSAKFAPDNHLWVVTGQGVFRSTTPVSAF